MRKIEETTLAVLRHRVAEGEVLLVRTADGQLITTADAGETITLAAGREMYVGTKKEIEAETLRRTRR